MYPFRILPRYKDIAAVCVGNALEWFEIVVFGYFAGFIAARFFPTEIPTIALLLGFASFGVTFIARPFGAAFLGVYADRFGRRPALQVSVVLMMVASLAIAVLPDYNAIGIAAPVLLVIARMLQGFAIGGEFGSATVYLAEQDPKRRGFYASFQFASQGLAAALATLTAAILAGSLSPEQLGSWGWRIPFFLSVTLAPFIYYIRSTLVETVEFERTKSTRHESTGLPQRHGSRVTIAVCIVALGTVLTYTVIYLPTMATRDLGISAPNSFFVAFVTACVQIVIVPIVGMLSDQITVRLWIPIATASLTAIIVFSMFDWLVASPSIERLVVVQVILGALAATYFASIPAILAELFPVRFRTTGLSIGYSVGVAVFGGFTPFIHVWTTQYFDTLTAVSYYVILSAVLSLLALIIILDRSDGANLMNPEMGGA